MPEPDRSGPSPRPLLALLLLVSGTAALLAAGFMVLRTPALVIYDGATPIEVEGDYATVGDALDAAGVALNPGDLVLPPPESIIAPGEVIQVARARAVQVAAEAGRRTYWTQQQTLGAFFRDAGIVVERTDQIYADDRPVAFGEFDAVPLPSEVEIGNFLTVTIHDAGRQQVLRTAATTVGQALNEAGIVLFAADDVEPAPGAWLSPDLQIFVRRSMPLTIRADGRDIQTRSYKTNALAVLAEAGIGLVGRDYAQPGPEVVLQPNDVIEVVRVTEDFRVVDEPIAYETVWQPTDRLELDQRGLLQAGEAGILRRRFRVTYENGLQVGEALDGEWVALAPVDAIMGFGTRIVTRVVDTPEGPREYYRVVRMRVTAYTASSSGKPPDHPTYGITRSGLPAGTGIVAVDPRVVPWMSQVYVPGYGVGLAGDTGGGVKGRWIDLGYDEDEYVGWSGYVDVYYLTPVPEGINYLLPTVLP